MGCFWVEHLTLLTKHVHRFKIYVFYVSRVGSLAAAAHLLNDNTGDLRSVQCKRKSHVEFKVKSWFDFDFQYESEHWKVWPSNPLDFWIAKLEVSEKLPQG